MIYLKQEAIGKILLENRKEKVKTLNKLIEICKINNIGKRVEKQRIEFSREEIKIIRKIGKFLIWIMENECKNFRTKKETEEMIQVLVDSLKNNKSVIFFALFCPAYKKGRRAYGFKKKIGNTTKRGINNLSNLFGIAKSLGINCEAKAIFCDLVLENFSNLKKEDFKDLKNNFQSFFKYGLEKDPKIIYKKASEIGNLKEIVTQKGVVRGDIPTPKALLNRAFRRSISFYKEILGWKEDHIYKRTQDLSRSCAAIGSEIRRLYPLSIMLMTENIYERAVFYSGDRIYTKPIPTFYPRKQK